MAAAANSRRTVAIISALVLMVAMGVALWLWRGATGLAAVAVVEPPTPRLVEPAAGPDAASVVAAPEAPALEAVVAAVEGKVERQRGTDWSAVAVGDRVKAEDSLRTGTTGRADLEIGASSHVTVAENTQVKVAELTKAVHRFRIRRGRVAAAYQPDGERVLRIEGENGEAVAEAREARFSVRATDTTFAVATVTGTVNLRSAGATIAVGAGQLSVAEGGRAPSPAAPIPAKVLLKIAAAAKGDPCATIEGLASPGAEVQVDDELAAVAGDGRFRVQVPGKGKREVRVVVRDVAGNTREQRLVCVATPDNEQSIDHMKIRWK
jgi:hypothetical protein